MESVRNLVKKAEKRKNAGGGLCARMHRFLAEYKLRREQSKVFEGINRLPLHRRIWYAFVKRRLRACYGRHLQNLKNIAGRRKIRVLFHVSNPCKWHGYALYKLFAENENFDPLVLASGVKVSGAQSGTADGCSGDDVSYLRSCGMRVEEAHCRLTNECVAMAHFSPDIVIYHNPWGIDPKQGVIHAASHALTCYIPYCCHMMISEFDYMERFHRLLWKYFVESEAHVESYRMRFAADNCVAVGNLHLDRYATESPDASKFWKDRSPTKKRIIYAPHFTFNASHMMATFRENGRFMLSMASMYPDTTWVLRPHPDFDMHAVCDGIMTASELKEYYGAWEKYGTTFRGAEYIDLFKTSDCLITDCISFLADYLPTGKPVFFLRSSRQSVDFNDFGKKIVDAYYQINSNADLDRLFSRVIVRGDDFMEKQRMALIGELMPSVGNNPSRRVFECIKSELGIE
jgi:hypothetical protein